MEAKHRRELEVQLPGVIKEQREFWAEGCGPGRGAHFVLSTFANFKQVLQPQAFKVMSEWDEEGSIVLSSPDKYGVGKTHLAAALVNKLLETKVAAVIGQQGHIYRLECPVYFIGEVDLLARIRATFNRRKDDENGGETEAEVFEQLNGVGLLIIDDVGKTRSRDPAFLQGVYYRLVDHRYTYESPLILLTNLTLAELEEHIGGACADRLREMCDGRLVIMKGQSYRIPPKKEPLNAPLPQ